MQKTKKKKEWRQKGGDQVENERSFFLMSLFLSLPRRQGNGVTGDLKRERKLRNC